MTLYHIFIDTVVPIFVLIGVGFVMDKKFRLDLPTLSKLNFYVFVPALIFVKMRGAEIDTDTMLRVGGYTVVHMLALYGIARLVLLYKGLHEMKPVISLGAVFYNCGNYGIPLVTMAFGEDQLGALAVVIMTQNLLNFTWGIYLIEKNMRGLRKVLTTFAKVPTLYAATAALALRAWDLPLPVQMAVPLDYMSDGLIAVALITLGAQLSRSLGLTNLGPLSIVTGLRLIVSPIVAAVIVWSFGFSGALASMLIVIAGTPVAVNVYILAAQYEREEDVASQAVFWSTLLSALTLSVLLLLTQ